MRNRLKINLLVALSLIFLSAGCKRETDYLITIKTRFGEMKLVLFDDTPLHKSNFIDLAEKGMYDSTTFHRVIDEFMIQGGNINQKIGMSDSITYTIPAEFRQQYFHRRGAIGAARNNNPEKASNGSQFYIVEGRLWTRRELETDPDKLNEAVRHLIRKPGYLHWGDSLAYLYEKQDFNRYNALMLSLAKDAAFHSGINVKRELVPERLEAYTTHGGAPWLDDEYTVFGQLVEGFDVLDAISKVRTVAQDLPAEKIYLTVDLEELPKKEITKRYGIQYDNE